MFQNLKKGSTVYVLDTRDIPRFYTASVKDVGLPYYPQPNPGQLSPFSQQYINITIDNHEPWGVPANLDVVSKDGITVSMTREGLMPAVTAGKQESIDAVNSYERHKSNMTAYEEILKELDPSYAKAKAQDEEIKNLRSIIDGLNDKLSKVPTLEDLRGLLSKPEPTKSK